MIDRKPLTPRKAVGSHSVEAFSAVLSSLAVALSLALVAPPQRAQAQEAATQINIQRQSLSDALLQLGQQTSLQFIYTIDLVQGISVPAVSGRMPSEEALRRLLAGTGIHYSRNGNTINLWKTAETTQLAPVTVVGSSDGLPPAYAGGQVATGGGIGMLGNKDVMDTPFSQINYTNKTIQDQQAQTVQDVLANDPSVITITRNNVNSDIDYTRGFWNQAIQGTRSLNGLPGIAPLDSPSTDYIERVEMFKGPSALTNGNLGNLGGTVNLVTKKAADEPLTQLTTSYLSDSRFGAHVDVGRRFGEAKEFGIRFNGALSGGDTSFENQHSKFRSAALNLDYRGDRVRLSADVAHQFQDLRAPAFSLSLMSVAGLLSEVPKAPSNSTAMGASWSSGFSESTLGVLQGEVDILDNVTAYAAIGAQRYENEMTGMGGLHLLDNNGNVGYDHGMSRYRLNARSMQGGIRATAATGPIKHTLNLNVSKANFERRDVYQWGAPISVGSLYDPDFGHAPIIADIGDPRKLSESKVSSIGIADTMSFFDERIQFTAGIRRQNVEVTNFNQTTGLVATKYDSSAWTPAFGLVVRPWENISLYANYIEGLQQGTIVDSQYYANGGEVFAPYVSKQYEAGVKVDWGSLTTTLAAFQITQPSALAVPDPAGGLPTLTRDGKQRNRGIELSAYGELARGVRLLSGVTFLDARRLNTGNVAFDGTRAAGAPAFRAVIGGEWDTPFVQGLTLTGRLTYTSDSVVSNRVPDLRIPSWTSVDVGARYTFDSPWNKQPVIVRFSVDNVFDRAYWTQLHFGGIIARGNPRTYRLSATFNF